MSRDIRSAFCGQRSAVSLPGNSSAVTGVLLVLLALAWLPGQGQASATRTWLAVGVLPFALTGAPWSRVGRRAWWLLPWGVLALWALVGAHWLRDPGGGVESFLIQSSWTAALALGLALAGDRRARAAIPLWVAGAGAAAALPGLFVPGGTFGNTSLLAGLLAGTATWTAATVLAGGRVRDRTWALLLVSLGLQLGSLARCDSLAGWAGLAVGIAAWTGAATARHRVGRWALAAGLGALLAAGAAGGLLADPLAEHVRGRAHMARCSWSAARHALPLGVGAGQFHGAYLDAQAAVIDGRPDDRRFWSNAHHAHLEALHALAERGPLGVALLLIPLVAALLRPRRSEPWSVVVALGVVGLVSLPLYEPASWVLAALATGLVLGGAPGAAEPRREPLWRVWAAGALALPCGLAASADLLGDRLLVRAVEEHDPILAGTAARLSLRRSRPLQHRAALLLDGDPELAETLALQAVALDPSTAGWMLAGDAAMHVPDPARAVPHYLEAVRLDPQRFAGHFNLARAYEESGDRLSARRHAERARSLRPSDPRLDWLPR